MATDANGFEVAESPTDENGFEIAPETDANGFEVVDHGTGQGVFSKLWQNRHESLIGLSPEDIPSGANTTVPALTIPISAGAKMAAGVGQWATSPQGLAEMGVAATPAAPAVLAKWAYDMLKGGRKSAEDAGSEMANTLQDAIANRMISANQLGVPPAATPEQMQEHIQNLAEDAVNSAAMGLGALGTIAHIPGKAPRLQHEEITAGNIPPTAPEMPQEAPKPVAPQPTPTEAAPTPPGGVQAPVEAPPEPTVIDAKTADELLDRLTRGQLRIKSEEQKAPVVATQAPESPPTRETLSEESQSSTENTPEVQVGQPPTTDQNGFEVVKETPEDLQAQLDQELGQERGEPNAIQEPSAEGVPVGEPPGNRPEVGQGVPEPEAPPQEGGPAPAPTEAKQTESLADKLSKAMPNQQGVVELENGATLIISGNVDPESAADAPLRITTVDNEGVPWGHHNVKDWEQVVKDIAPFEPRIKRIIPKGDISRRGPLGGNISALGVLDPEFWKQAYEGLPGKEERAKAADYIKGTLGTIAGKTLPRITQGNRTAGEAGASYVSSRITAPFMGRLFSHNVLGGTEIDPNRFGAALSEDNLRSIRAAHTKAAMEAKTPEEAQKAQKLADSTFTFIGEKKPFKNEQEYQDFLKDPEVQQAIERHKGYWNGEVEPIYKAAMRIDPDMELPTRGIQTGARVNLRAIQEGEEVPPTAVWGSSAGNLLNTMQRKSPFGVRAKGTGQAYDANYDNLMQGTFGKQLEIANKNLFDDALVKSGLAEIGGPADKPIIGGEETVGFPIQRKTVVVPGEGAFSQNKTLWIKRSLSREYRNAANVDDNPWKDVVAVKAFSALSRAALAGLTDATVHITNLTTSLLQLPTSKLNLIADTLLSAAGRLDVPIAMARTAIRGAPEAARAITQSRLLKPITPDVLTDAIDKAYWKNQGEFARLANIGAMKEQGLSHGIPPFRQMSEVVKWYDRTTRLVLSDAFRDLAKRGVFENNPTNEREFINQVGQYNKRVQGVVIRAARNSGLAPFATAGRAFNVLGVRAATLNPGAPATSAMNAGLLRLNMLSKWGGTLAFVGLCNYAITGRIFGRPGTPIGYVDKGTNDAQGRMENFPVINLTGQGRALRVIGARGAIEAARKGLPAQTAFDSAARDVVNSWVAPFAGPPVKFGVDAATGQEPGVGLPRASKVVPPGQSQTLQNLKDAAIAANPLVKGLSKANEPGMDWKEILKSQLPRFTMQTSQPEQMIANYPTIVRKAQANAFLEDVIHQARYMPQPDKQKFLLESLQKLDPADQEHAIRELKFRHVIP